MKKLILTAIVLAMPFMASAQKNNTGIQRPKTDGQQAVQPTAPATPVQPATTTTLKPQAPTNTTVVKPKTVADKKDELTPGTPQKNNLLKNKK